MVKLLAVTDSVYLHREAELCAECSLALMCHWNRQEDFL